MFRKCGIVLLTLVLTGALAACGGTNNVGADLTPDRSTNGFVLNVMDESYIDGGKATGFNLEVEDYGDDVVVQVTVEGAQGLKAMYFDMEYDAAAYTPSGVRPMGALVEVDSLIQLTYLAERGKVYHGQVVPNYQWREGLTGDAVIARVMFHKGAAPQVRGVSAAPTSALSASTLSGDGAGMLSWRYYSQADTDQNTEVAIPDLTPIGANMGTTGAQDDPNSALSAADADHNGEVNVSDLSALGANWGNSTAGGWNVYAVLTALEVPGFGEANPAGATLLGNVAHAAAVSNLGERRLFSFDGSANNGEWAYVRADDGQGNEGTPSNGWEIGGVPPVGDVILTLINFPAGQNEATRGQVTLPYIVEDATVWEFSVVDNADAGADVTEEVDTTWVVSDPGAGAINEGGVGRTLDITDGYVGTFNIQATHDGVASGRLYMTIEGPATGIFIQKDDADPEWAAIPGIGSSADPYILESTAPHDEEYTMEAFLGADNTGDVIDITTLTWHADPEFLLTWPTGGTFIPNQFTNTPMHAEDGTYQSNLLYVVIQGLPS